MTSREGISRPRLRQTAPIVDQVLTPLGRAPIPSPSVSNNSSLNPLNAAANSTTVIQISGNVRARHPISNNNNNLNLESDSNSIVDVGLFESTDPTPPVTFDADKFRADIKAKRLDSKGLEESILKAIQYLLTTSKRSSQQQLADYTVLPFLAWAASLHADVFRRSSVLKAMCLLLKGSTLTKSIKTFPPVNNGNNNSTFDTTTPYTLVCQILWSAYKVRRRRECVDFFY